jgi:hypothetical protein
MGPAGRSFDPLAIIGALERNYVDYVLIGGLAQVLRGADTITTGVDVCPSFAKGNLERLNTAINERATGGDSEPPAAIDEQSLSAADVVPVATAAGELKVIAAPAGVPNGYVDLRRAATREDLGHGLRPLVASSGDLAAMAGALGRDQDRERLAMLRRIVELEVSRQPIAPRPTRAATGSTRATSRVRSAKP